MVNSPDTTNMAAVAQAERRTRARPDPGARYPLTDATPADRARAVPLRGWGPDRSAEAVEIFRLVAPGQPRMLSYAPSGFTVSFAQSSLFTPDAALLRAHWSAFREQQQKRVAVYPWGVSVQQ